MYGGFYWSIEGAESGLFKGNRKRKRKHLSNSKKSLISYNFTKVTIKGSAFWVNHIKKKKSEGIIIKIDNNLPKRSKYIVDN